MRVLHIGKFYAPQRGGIERHLQDLAEWFADRGNRVGALVHQPGGRWRSEAELIRGVEVVRVGCIATVLYTPVSPTFPWQLRKALENVQPEMLHLHLPNPSCFSVLASPRARALPWIVHWHADVSTDVPDWRVRAAYRVYRPFEQALLERAEAIVVTSQNYADASTALARWKSKIRVVPLGIDSATITPGNAPGWPRQHGLRVLSVGRLSHYKGHAVLLEALASVPDASLVLVGAGEESARLRASATRLGVEDRVAFVGEVSDAELAAAYAAADVFVLPSLDRSEAFGLVLLEAMRAGRAVIASDIPGSGVGWVVEDGVTGLLVPPRDARALAAALTDLRDDDLRQRIGQAGQRRWQEKFTLERSAQSVLALYRALDRRGGPTADPSG